MTNSLTRLGALAQHPKRIALLAIAVVALLLAVTPRAARADSYYQVNGCYGSTLTWGSFENLSGTNPNGYGNTETCGTSNYLASTVETSGTSQALWNAYAPNSPGTNYIHGISDSSYVITAAANHNAGWAAADPSWAAGQGTSGSGSIDSPNANNPSNLYFGGAQAVGLTSGDCLSQSSSCSNVDNNAFSFSAPDRTLVGIGIGATTTGVSNYSSASITNPAVQIDDPDSSPYLTASSSSLNSGSQWYSDATNSNVTGSATVADNSGVCDLQIDLENASGGVVSGSTQGSLGNAPGSWDPGTSTYNINLAPGGQINAPCGGSANISTTVALSSITAPGAYHFVETAQNPGNVEAQYNPGAASGSPSMGVNDIGTVLVDNQVPSVSISGGTGHWTSQGNQTYNVSASEAQNASGIASITCTGAGLPAGGRTFGGSSTSITENAQGDDAISCYATTNAGVSGADGATQNSNVGTEGTANNILIDTSTPSVAIDNDSPATKADGLIGDWVDPSTSGTSETVDVYAGAGVSGVAAGSTNGSTNTPASGTIDQWSTGGDAITSGVSTNTSLYNSNVANNGLSKATISGNTYGMPYCTVTDLSDPTTQGGSTFVSYNAAAGDATIGNAAATPSIDADNQYVEWQIPFTANGHYQLACQVTNGAGVTSTLATQTIEVDNTSSADLASAAANSPIVAGGTVDYVDSGDASADVSKTGSANATWSGDPLTLTYTPAANISDWPATADVTDTSEVDPITQTNCIPGGGAAGEQTSNTVATTVNGANPSLTAPNGITIGDTQYQPQADNKPATQTPTNNGEDQVVCTETNAAGTTSDPTTYYMNIDQQTPTVAYSQPPGDTGGQDNGNAVSAAMTPAALSAKTGLPAKDFGLAPLTSKVPATSSDPVPATGHLAPTGPAEFKLGGNDSTTGVQYSDTATQVDAAASEHDPTLSGIDGEFCSDTNQTQTGAYGNVPQYYNGGNAIGGGGTTATLDVPQPSNTNDDVTGIHSLDCYGLDVATFTGSSANGPFSGAGSTVTNYPYQSNQAQYNYTVNIDDVSPANIGWGIVNQGETVTNPDPYSYNSGTWYQDEATLTATAQAVGNDLSDIDAIVCGVNDPSFGQPNSTYTDPVSGQQVPYYDYTLDPNAFQRPTDANNDYTIEIPVSVQNGAAGPYYISCFAVSGSGVNGAVTTTEVNLQPSSGPGTGGGTCTQFCQGSPDPSLDVPPSGIGTASGGTGWSRTDETVQVIAQTPSGSAPVESITCNEPPATLNGDTSNPNAVDNGDGTITYPNPAGTDSNTETITVTVTGPPVGEAQPALECFATDAAGVDHTLGSEQINVDETPPTGAFVQPNKSNPRLVTLDATDNNGSGIAKVVIQLIDATGKITTLPLTSNTTGDGAYTAELPADNTMAKGAYTLQGIVTDNAGNVTNPPITQWQNGQQAVIKYPVLGSASMIDALGAGTTAPLLPGDKGTTSTKVPRTRKVRVKVHGKWVTKTEKVYKTVRVKVKAKAARGKTKWVTKKVLEYKTVKATAKVVLANVKTPVKLAYNGKSTADGLVTTGSGVPVAGGTVQISETINGTSKVIGSATTNNAGRWVYHVPAGPSRQLSFQYTGTDTIDAASGSSGAELVTGKATISAPRVVKVRSKYTLRGTLAGGYIPAQGVPFYIEYSASHEKGVGNLNNKIYYTNGKGKFSIKLPALPVTRGHIYEFWVKAVKSSSWPYNGATSKKTKVRFN